MVPLLCEDILRRVLVFLIALECKESYISAESVVPNFMLVGRTWLEVGRQWLYDRPDIRDSMDSVYLFQTSILHLNHNLGTYVRSLQARGVGVGHLMLARMVSRMPNLQALEVESLDFVEYYPESVGIPDLSRLAVHAPYNTPTSLAVRRRTSRELVLDAGKLDWILNARDVRLSGQRIRAERAIKSLSQPRTLELLLLDRCEWDFSTSAEVIPQICCGIKELFIVDFGLTVEQMPSWWANPLWTQRNEPSPRGASSHVVQAMLPSFYGLCRNISRLEIQYAPHCVFSASPNLSLLSGDIEFCGVDYQGSQSFHPDTYQYPPGVKNLYVKLSQLDYGLLLFIQDLQDPEHLAKLKTHPYIWIKVPWGSPTGLSITAAERWETARKLAAATLAQRGLDVTLQPFELVEKPRSLYQTEYIEYSSFWCMSFLPPTETGVQVQGDALGGADGEDGSAAV